MTIEKKIKLAIIFCLSSFAPLNGQNQNKDLFSSYSKLLSPEKVYVQTDKEKYAVGDTIWFSAFLKNSSELSEYAECNYVYAEIIGETFEASTYTGGKHINKVLQRIKLKRTGDSISGHFVVNESFNTGLVTLRAYSYWMLNQPPQMLFYKTLEIFNPLKDQYISDLIKAKLNNDRYFHAIGYDNPFRKNPLKPKKKEAIIVNLIPESGHYIPNVRTRFGAKVTSADGAGLRCKVNVFCNEDKQPHLSFETNDQGLSVFEMIVPNGVNKLKAEVESDGEKPICKSHIPLPETKAVVITAQMDTSGISANIESFMMDSADSLFVLVFDKSEIYFRDTLNGSHSIFRFSYDKLSEGINSIAVIDRENNVLAERKVFVFPQQKFNVASSVQTKDVKNGEIVSVCLDVSNLTDGDAVNGNVSVSVTDGYLAPSSGSNHNILSYFLLGSESEEMIENAQHFFDESVNLYDRIKAADTLMLAQNFDYYKTAEIIKGKNKMPHFGREFTQSLSGHVTGPFGFKARSSTICFAAPSINFYFIGDLDSSAFFVLNELDFPDSTRFLVGAQGQRGLFKKWYAPVINVDHFAVETAYPKHFKASGYSEKYSEDFLNEYYTEGGEPLYTIQPAVVIATPNLSPFPDDNFKSDEYMSGRQLIPYASYTVTEMLAEVAHIRRSAVGALVYRRPMTEGFSLNELMEAGTAGSVVQYAPVITYINGMREDDANRLNTIMVDQVEAIGWKKGLAGSKYGYTMEQVLGPATAVFVKLKAPVTTPYNTIFEKPIGWQKPAFFDNSLEGKARAGVRRTTLFWDPSTRIEDGNLKLEFFRRKNGNPCVITVEGFLDNGQMFSYSKQL